jgi:hypothetical protein
VGRYSSVGIAACYGLVGPGIESHWGRDFPHPSSPGLGHSLLYNAYRNSFPGVKRPGRGVNHPPATSAEVKERVELYLYSPSGSSWPVLGRVLPLPFTTAVCFLYTAFKGSGTNQYSKNACVQQSAYFSARNPEQIFMKLCFLYHWTPLHFLGS